MTMPDDDAQRKPKRRRWGLFAPYVALVLAAAVWSVFWLVMKSQLQDRLIRESANLRTSGYEADWKALKIGGYPFRLEVELIEPRLVEPYGWGVSAPRLEAAANVYDPGHWMFVAPQGLTLARPAAGKVAVSGQFLRASIAGLGKAPRIAFEGEKMTFRPERGAEPFALTAAERMDFSLHAAEGDQAKVQWRLRGAQARRAGIFAQIAPLAPLSLTLAADLTKRSAFGGRDWSSGVRRWIDAGGEAQVDQLLVSVGDVSLSAHGGPLTVGADGRLRGSLDMALRQGAAALAALGAAQALDPNIAQSAAAVAGVRTDGGPELQLTFEAGMTTLGPVRIGPAPRIY